MEVRAVDIEQVRPLRRRVLRPHQRLAEMAWPGDGDPLALHLAAVGEDGEVVATLTVHRDPHPHDPREGDWRVRGMATEPAHRGRGLGARLLAGALEHAARHGAARVWCTARVPARALYERAGFRAEGEAFELPDIGPHLLMSRPVSAPS